MLTTLPLIEACCDSAETARQAEAFGAGRIELCGPSDGGSTPSLGLIAHVLDRVECPVFVMIRPHVRSFVYSDDDLHVMCNDIVTAKTLGAHGVVVGPLNADHTIDTRALATLVDVARPLPVTFHRAFDRVPDQLAALDTLLELGVARVLTSGQGATALAGAAQLAALQVQAGERLTVLAGGGVRGDHVHALLERAPLRELHARSTDPEIVRALAGALQQPRPS